MRKNPIILFFLVILISSPLIAQTENLEKLIESIFMISSSTGDEEPMAQRILEKLPASYNSKRDRLGSLFASQGNGKAKFAVITGMDEIGYIVSGVSSEGYLRMDRVVPAPHRLFDAFHHGHPMLIRTEKGTVSAVLTLPSSHILPREKRRDLMKLFTLENAFLDIGARNREEVIERGVAYLDPVTPLPVLNRLTGDKRSGYSLGGKACVALLLDLAQSLSSKNVISGTEFAWLAQTKFLSRRSRPRAALGALTGMKQLEAEFLVIIDVFPCDLDEKSEISLGNGPVLISANTEGSALLDLIKREAESKEILFQIDGNYSSYLMNPFISSKKSVVGLFLPVKFFATPSEVLDLRDVKALVQLLEYLITEGGKNG